MESKKDPETEKQPRKRAEALRNAGTLQPNMLKSKFTTQYAEV
jgi:hypothetical protein